jgi:hypothetical protein
MPHYHHYTYESCIQARTHLRQATHDTKPLMLRLREPPPASPSSSTALWPPTVAMLPRWRYLGVGPPQGQRHRGGRMGGRHGIQLQFKLALWSPACAHAAVMDTLHPCIYTPIFGNTKLQTQIETAHMQDLTWHPRAPRTKQANTQGAVTCWPGPPQSVGVRHCCSADKTQPHTAFVGRLAEAGQLPARGPHLNGSAAGGPLDSPYTGPLAIWLRTEAK